MAMYGYTATNDRVATRLPMATAWAIQEYTNIHRARITAEALRFFGDTYGYGLGYTGVYKHNRKHIYIYIEIYIYIYIQPHKSTSKHIIYK